MQDLRREIFGHLQRLARRLLRPQPGRAADDAGHDRRRRRERAVHVGRRHRVRRPLHARRHHGGDARARLAPGARHLRGAAALLRCSPNWFRRGRAQSFRETRKWVARINAFLQERLSGMSVVQLFRREAKNRAALRGDQPQPLDANMQAIFYYAVFYPMIELLAALATALILVYGGARVLDGRPHARRARRLHPVLRALLAADLGPLREVQRAAGRDGRLGADLRPARHAAPQVGSPPQRGAARRAPKAA